MRRLAPGLPTSRLLHRLCTGIRQLFSGRLGQAELARMSERELKDIGLIRSDLPRIGRGLPPPTERPLSGR